MFFRFQKMVKALGISFLLLGTSVSFSDSPGEVYAIVGATLIDGTGKAPLSDSVILFARGKIRATGKKDEIRIPPNAQIIQTYGKWVVPGLIDAHVHFSQSAGLYTRPDVIDLRYRRAYSTEMEWIQSRIPYTFSRYLCSGVTSVVDMGGPLWTLNLKHTASQTTGDPHVTAAGPLLSTVLPPELKSSDPSNIDLGTEEEAKATVDRLIDKGADLIKIWLIGTEHAPASYLPSLRATVQEAHAQGKRVAFHATELHLARLAVEAGADILVHSVTDRKIDPQFLQLLKQRRMIYIPTLMVDEGYREVLGDRIHLNPIEKRCGDPEIISTWSDPHPWVNAQELADSPIAAENLKRIAAAGIRIAAGSDAGNIGTLHGPGLHRELERMVEAGLTPEQALLSATRDAAFVTSPTPNRGTLEPGKQADLLILKANPLLDIRNLSQIEKVIRSGKIFDPT